MSVSLRDIEQIVLAGIGTCSSGPHLWRWSSEHSSRCHLQGVTARTARHRARGVGGEWVRGSVAGRGVGRAGRGAKTDPLAALTECEREVLQGAAEGLSNKEVAARLRLSEKTVKRYMTIIIDKLRVGSRTEAALLAQEGGERI